MKKVAQLRVSFERLFDHEWRKRIVCMIHKRLFHWNGRIIPVTL